MLSSLRKGALIPTMTQSAYLEACQQTHATHRTIACLHTQVLMCACTPEHKIVNVAHPPRKLIRHTQPSPPWSLHGLLLMAILLASALAFLLSGEMPKGSCWSLAFLTSWLRPAPGHVANTSQCSNSGWESQLGICASHAACVPISA